MLVSDPDLLLLTLLSNDPNPPWPDLAETGSKLKKRVNKGLIKIPKKYHPYRPKQEWWDIQETWEPSEEYVNKRQRVFNQRSREEMLRQILYGE